MLHADHIGSVPFPAGQYRIATNQLSCATASQLFSRFLEDYDGILPTPWQLIANIRRFQKVGTASEFQVTPLAPPKPTSLVCPGTFSVLHNDHIGAMSVPAGRWQMRPRCSACCARGRTAFAPGRLRTGANTGRDTARRAH